MNVVQTDSDVVREDFFWFFKNSLTFFRDLGGFENIRLEIYKLLKNFELDFKKK